MSAPCSDIRSAFITYLNSFPDLPAVAWENIAFKPVDGLPYIRPALLPAEPFQAELGANGSDRHTGIYQISVYAPEGTGVNAINTLRDSLINYFKRGTVLTYNDLTVTITKSYCGPTMQESAWLHVPVSILYRVYAAN